MHEARTASDVSDAVAAFAIAAHRGAAFEAAAAASDVQVRAAADVYDADLAGALSAEGAALRDAFARGAALARDARYADSAAIVAAALAAARANGADARATAVAVAVGCEVAARVRRGAAAAPDFAERWNVRAVAGRFGAAMCAARLYGLDPLQARHALGLAATQAAGLRADGDDLPCAKAAFDALEAAALAKAGFTSATASVEGRRGFAAVMAPGFATSALVDGLGERWRSTEAAPA